MASLIYNSGKELILKTDLTGITLKCALVTSSYTADKDAHENFDDITNEISGTGYTAGGATLANVSTNIDDTNDRGELDADDVTWASSTLTARAGVLYYSTGTAATSTLIAYIDFGEDYSSDSSDFVIEWNSEGILALGE